MMGFDLYQTITDRIIVELEKGTVPWQRPWTCPTGAISHVTGKPYSVAELGAAYIVNAARLETVASFRNSAAYIQNWLEVLKNDKRFIVSAAGKAEKAVKLILGEQMEDSPDS